MTCYSKHSCVRGNFSWPLWTDGSWQSCTPVIICRAFLGLVAPDEQAAGCLWPSEASHCSISVLHDHYRGTQVSASQGKWGAKGHTKLALAQVKGHVSPRTASLPLDFFVFLSSRKADRHRSTSKEKKKKPKQLLKRVCPFTSRILPKKPHTINMFYSLGIHWHLMESCKNILENNSNFLFCSLFHF